jgi:anaerobic magnesium-protoporphyrin IX monomethyl ester cyclase
MIENLLSLAEGHRAMASSNGRYSDAGSTTPLDVLVLAPPKPHGDWPPSTCRPLRAGHPLRADAGVPQTGLAQIGAVLHAAGYSVDIVDAIGMGMSWEALERRLWERRPRYLIVQTAAPTLTNDMRATLIGKAVGSVTLAIGPHVSPMSRETLEAYPTLDIVVRGEPELTILEVVQALDRLTQAECVREVALPSIFETAPPRHASPFAHAAYPAIRRRFLGIGPDLIALTLRETHGIAFRDEHIQVRINPDRALVENLDSLPIPLHDSLPWRAYQHPFSGAPYACVHTSRGCPASCHFCAKHIFYPTSVRHRSTDHVMKELSTIADLGLRYVHFDADLFTVKKEFIYDLCSALIDNHIALHWSCNSRVDSVDEAELQIMKQAGCCMIGWGIESGSEAVLRRAGKRTTIACIQDTIAASRRVGIKNWGHFLIGLPGETTDSIHETIGLSKRLPLDRAQFQVAAPLPGTPFYHEAAQNGWLAIERWEDYGTRAVLNYPHLSARQLEHWARRAARAWSLRPGPVLTFLKDLLRPDTVEQFGDMDGHQASWRDGNLVEA